jgi:2-keto-4-pentenoate hydratase/2-oxohepta-3-ene-1,7-dioic acid hydratase in catechol pathway
VRWGSEGDALVDAGELAPSLRQFLTQGGDASALRDLRGERVSMDDATFLAPVPEPSKIWCCGLNYDDSRQMLGLEFLPARRPSSRRPPLSSVRTGWRGSPAGTALSSTSGS